MGVVASSQGEGKKFEQATEMIQQAVIADVVDKGMVDNKFKPGTKQHKAYFTWILEELDSEGKNKRVFQGFTVSLHEKSTLRKTLKGFGMEVTKAPAGTKGPDGKNVTELFNGQVNVDLDEYIGTARTLLMSTEDGDNGEPYIKILGSQKPVGKGMSIPKDFVRKQDQPPF